MTADQGLHLGRSPEILPHSFHDGGLIRLVRLNEEAYRSASFLDARADRYVEAERMAPWSEVEAETGRLGLGIRINFIFHIGHVGSTLLSRVLGDHPRILSLREPQALWMMAQPRALTPGDILLGPFGRLSSVLPVFARLWSRSFRPEQETLLKATSYASELAGDLVALDPDARAILLTASPQAHIATLYSGPAAIKELNAFAPGRWARLNRLLATPPAKDWRALSRGALSAMTWAAEMASLGLFARASASRALVLDFDDWLKDPARGIATSLTHLHGDADPSTVGRLAQSAHLTRYSKAPQHAFDAQTRQALLSQAWRENLNEIREGLAWLDRLIETNPKLAQALQPFLRG